MTNYLQTKIKTLSWLPHALAAAGILAGSGPLFAADQKPGMGIEEIVVTARKREESLQDTPIAISAFTGEGLDIRGVTDLARLDNFAPNLVLRRSPSNSGVTNAAVYIRGIGQNDFVPVIDPGVGIYVDGVYLGRSVGAVLDLVDIERVEVLRGPQGTLFGKNTIGGAVSLTTKRPSDVFEGRVRAKVGTDSRVNLDATVNIPLSESFMTRFTVASFKQDGYVKRVFDGKDLGDDDTIAGRVTALWLVNDDVEITFSADYSKDDENGPPLVLTGILPINEGLFGPGGAPSMALWQNTFVAQLAAGGIVPGGEFFDPVAEFPFNFLACFNPPNLNNPNCFNEQYIQPAGGKLNYGTDPTKSELETWGTSVTLDWDINENLTFKAIGAYRTFDGTFWDDNDAAPQKVSELIDIFDQDQTSVELQLLGKAFDNRLNWILGYYYFQEDGKNINPVRFSQVWIQSGGYFDSDSWALFGQGTFALTEQLDLTLGLRYTEDTKRYLPDQFFEFFPTGPLPLPPCPGTGLPCEVGDRVLPYVEESTTSKEWTPMVNLAYRWNDNLMTYVSYSKGFKGGGFTQRIFPPEPSLPDFGPEFVKSYEGGFKYNGWDDRLRLNGAVFFTDYTDIQLLVADPTRVGPFVTNAGDAEIKGFELELLLAPAEGWLISGSVGYLDPKRTKVGTGVQGLTKQSRFENISDWNANAQILKDFDMDNMGIFTPRVEWSYRSSYGTNSNNVPYDGPPAAPPFLGVPDLGFGVTNPAQFQPSYNLWNASLRWQAANSGLSLTAGVDNIGDKQYRHFGNQQDAFGFNIEIFDRGRQWYLEASYEF